jgi:hypothetical protein
VTLAQMFALADRQSYFSHTSQPDDIYNAINKAGLRIYLWISKEMSNFFIKWDTTTIQTVIGQDEYSCPPDLATMIRFGERVPGETNYRRIQPADVRTDIFANRQFETIVLSLDLLQSDFVYMGPYLPRAAGPQAIVCLAPNGTFWQFGINDAGLPTSTPMFGSALPPITPFFLNDPGNTTSWQLVVSNAGVFSWQTVAFSASYQVSPFVMATLPLNQQTSLGVTNTGTWPPPIQKPSQVKYPFKVRLAPAPSDLRQTEIIYAAKWLDIYNANSYNVIPDEGHQAQLDFAKAELMRGNSDDLADKYEQLAMQEVTEFLTFVRNRQNQQPSRQETYLTDLE